MKQALRWCDKYELGLKENLSVNEIMKLRDCGRPKATAIRDDVIKYCVLNGIEIDLRKVPTSVVFVITGYDLDYYYDKMIQESKCLRYQ